jgi:hypothetical protein
MGLHNYLQEVNNDDPILVGIWLRSIGTYGILGS